MRYLTLPLDHGEICVESVFNNQVSVNKVKGRVEGYPYSDLHDIAADRLYLLLSLPYLL